MPATVGAGGVAVHIAVQHQGIPCPHLCGGFAAHVQPGRVCSECEANSASVIANSSNIIANNANISANSSLNEHLLKYM